jgi:hypothetical protein
VDWANRRSIHRMVGGRYHFLKETCPSTEVGKMMGRVVKDPFYPLDKYVPEEPLSEDEPTHNTSDIHPTILQEPLTYENRTDSIEYSGESAARAGLASLFNIDLTSRTEEGLSMKSQTVKRYTLKNPEKIFDKLMTNEDYASEVRALLRKTTFGKAYFVVGFYTTTGTIWTQSQRQRRTGGFKLAVPISAIVGDAAGLVNPHTSASLSRVTTQMLQMSVVQEEIFAVAYHVLTTSWRKEKGPTLKGPLMNRSRLRFGDSDSSSDEEDDVITRMDLDPQEEEEAHSRRFNLSV